ncbi:MAG: hypothetical protein AABO41_12680 [Acidobacteriota bacterium]
MSEREEPQRLVQQDRVERFPTKRRQHSQKNKPARKRSDGDATVWIDLSPISSATSTAQQDVTESRRVILRAGT